MGDRGNIVIITEKDTIHNQVWFYTHWAGSEIGDIAKAGLMAAKNENRWKDEAYLARIVFNALQGDDRSGLGFGISTRMQDNGHDIVVIDVPRQRVFTINEDDLSQGRVPNNWEPLISQSFEDFATP